MEDRKMKKWIKPGERFSIQEPPVAVQEVPIRTPEDEPGSILLPIDAAIAAKLRAEADLVEYNAKAASARVDRDFHRSEIERLSRPPDRDRRFWPADKPLPDFYIKQAVPCPKCRRIRSDDGGRATICTSSGAAVAFFRCRCCEHRWKMAVKAS